MKQGCVATVGNFDGVHRGHRSVVEQVVHQAHQRGLEALVVTFPNHPLQVLRNDFKPRMLTAADEKVKLLRDTCIDRVALIEFTGALAQMSAYDFMRTVLKEQQNVEVLMMGYDNRFGHDRKGFKDCQTYGKDLGIEVLGCEELVNEGGVSSTAIRHLLQEGEVEKANHLLGYNYFLQGTVVAGFQNGRKLGYPTANLQVPPYKLIPENGAYLVTCQLPTVNSQLSTLNSQLPTPNSQLSTLTGMLNIGTRPTLHNGMQRSIEVHLFDFDGDLYGTTMKVELQHRLRGERKFDSLEALQQQLAEDEKACRNMKLTNLL